MAAEYALRNGTGATVVAEGLLLVTSWLVCICHSHATGRLIDLEGIAHHVAHPIWSASACSNVRDRRLAALPVRPVQARISIRPPGAGPTISRKPCSLTMAATKLSPRPAPGGLRIFSEREKRRRT